MILHKRIEELQDSLSLLKKKEEVLIKENTSLKEKLQTESEALKNEKEKTMDSMKLKAKHEATVELLDSQLREFERRKMEDAKCNIEHLNQRFGEV
ncbi:unnamed protein product [Darwinula stevensoni]|uniref:Uncharacterized protein n=1 Tax=Darwinula stevensoni TaxID=69355 RepID=A0A7R9A223_9CRUS|nr:unnamed protein product [Darwinula stevensoni]CAG0888881.1 unnamed protein product [Darwinula stevensoni]